ncbi:MAG: peroxiredoxin [Burkholderiales bacterium]|nr:peroxiredoxin [Burkholderiales bacterium]
MKKLAVAGLLAISLFASSAAEVGQAAPAFALTDQNGKTHTSDEYHGKWLVLYFYPKAGTPGCTEEACSFRDDIVVLHALGAEVVGVSTDSVDAIHAFGQEHTLPFTLLADTEGKVSETYGALTNLGLMKYAKRYTYLINPDGKVVKFYKDIDTKTYAKTIAADLRQLAGKSS